MQKLKPFQIVILETQNSENKIVHMGDPHIEFHNLHFKILNGSLSLVKIDTVALKCNALLPVKWKHLMMAFSQLVSVLYPNNSHDCKQWSSAKLFMPLMCEQKHIKVDTKVTKMIWVDVRFLTFTFNIWRGKVTLEFACKIAWRMSMSNFERATAGKCKVNQCQFKSIRCAYLTAGPIFWNKDCTSLSSLYRSTGKVHHFCNP